MTTRPPYARALGEVCPEPNSPDEQVLRLVARMDRERRTETDRERAAGACAGMQGQLDGYKAELTALEQRDLDIRVAALRDSLSWWLVALDTQGTAPRLFATLTGTARCAQMAVYQLIAATCETPGMDRREAPFSGVWTLARRDIAGGETTISHDSGNALDPFSGPASDREARALVVTLESVMLGGFAERADVVDAYATLYRDKAPAAFAGWLARRHERRAQARPHTPDLHAVAATIAARMRKGLTKKEEAAA